ncbi:uncharacterized protein ATNIH1004_002341 [Aspergillus tanneri]|uniref:DUF7136 domain-containing protein n=1 Tax=Aspergillus tanneri TaxID=1220188 RepID=A0A5M9MWF7_9EURO|nr:uncharacterized protein ATNIH1004_002341 [Aspergillus tanneri]KAA8649670.1 hypothetical protein ATNIH1004_002341 [Aspergillus tanneri]
MHFSLLVGVAVGLGAIVGASGVLEVDLVFPRNETYAPTDYFPVVFALQNAERARYLKSQLKLQRHQDCCDEDGLSKNPVRGNIIRNSTNRSTSFTIKNSGLKVDLVAATANKSCPGEDNGVAINVTDKTMLVPWGGGLLYPDADTRSLSRRDRLVHTASMEASLRARLCDKFKTVNPPADCPDDENAAQQLAVFGISCLLAAL